MKILLYSAINPFSELETRYPELGLSYLAGAILNTYTDCTVKIVFSDFKKELTSFDPDFVGIKSVTQNFSTACRASKICHEKKIPCIIGGVHISVLPETLLSNQSFFNLAVIGEGERTIIDLIEHFEKYKNFKINNALLKIPGIACLHHNKLYLSIKREQIKDLDTIAFPARNLIKISRRTTMITSRGCPFNCSFCSSSQFWGGVRYFSAQYVVDEIQYLISHYKVNFISFIDDLFIGNRKRVFEISDLLRRTNHISKVKFACQAHPSMIDEEILDALKAMNVKLISSLGIESGNERILKKLKKGTTSVETNYKAIQLIKKAGIKVNGSFILGHPEESAAEMMDTYKFIKKSGLNMFEIYILTPYPGTDMWDYYCSKNIVSPEMDFGLLNFLPKRIENRPLFFEAMSKNDFLRIYIKFRRLRYIHNMFGIWSNPMLRMLPRYIFMKMAEKFIEGKNE